MARRRNRRHGHREPLRARRRPPELVDVDEFNRLQAALARASAEVPFDAIWPAWLERAVGCFAEPDRARARAVLEGDVDGWRRAYAAGGP